jgi:chloramphenicol 3-O phosphotransferase
MREDAEVEPGNIVFLNGTSSAGKSSIARAVQEVMDVPYLHTGIDHFLERVPPGFIVASDGVNPAEAAGFLAVIGPGPRLTEVRIGPAGRRLLAGMYAAIAALSAAGQHVVVDDVIHDRRVLRTMVAALRDAPVLFVGVQVPLAEAERRELARGDRLPGGAGAFYPHVHAHGVYDLEIDATTATPHDCAARIKTALATGHPRTALRRLAAELGA